MTDTAVTLPQRVPLRDIVLYFLRLGTLGFGGPVALEADWRPAAWGHRRPPPQP